MHFRVFYKITVYWDFALWSIQGLAWGPVKQALHEVQLRGKHSPLSPPQTTQSYSLTTAGTEVCFQPYLTGNLGPYSRPSQETRVLKVPATSMLPSSESPSFSPNFRLDMIVYVFQLEEYKVLHLIQSREHPPYTVPHAGIQHQHIVAGRLGAIIAGWPERHRPRGFPLAAISHPERFGPKGNVGVLPGTHPLRKIMKIKYRWIAGVCLIQAFSILCAEALSKSPIHDKSHQSLANSLKQNKQTKKPFNYFLFFTLPKQPISLHKRNLRRRDGKSRNGKK